MAGGKFQYREEIVRYLTSMNAHTGQGCPQRVALASGESQTEEDFPEWWECTCTESQVDTN